MTERDWSDWSQFSRRCPHCGAQVTTLGSSCPKCGKPFAPRSLFDRLPMNMSSGVTIRMWAIIALVLVIAWVWLVTIHLVAAIVLAGAAFALLVGFVALNNWLLSREQPRDGGG